MRSNGMASMAIDGVQQVGFGDPCPGECDGGIAVHQAVIPMIDEGGDVVLPTYYALCCACHRKQYVQKYGIEFLLPCGCDDVNLAEVARLSRDAASARLADGTAEAEALRVFRQRVAGELSNA